MNLSDIIALAKQGYKPNDIKELISMSEATTESQVEVTETETETETNDEVETTEVAHDVKESPDLNVINELKDKIASLESELKIAQANNSSEGESSNDALTNSDKLKEIFRAFM